MFFVILFVIETFCKKYTTLQTSFLQATSGFRRQPERAASAPFQNKSAKNKSAKICVYGNFVVSLQPRSAKIAPMVQKFHCCPQIAQIEQKFLATIYIIIYKE